MVCYLFRFNPGACLCVDIPQRPFNHLRIQPLIVTKCFSLFFRGLQLYFEIVFSYGKVARDWLSVCFYWTLLACERQAFLLAYRR